MHLNKLMNQDGFSLGELSIGVAIFSMLVYGGNYFLKIGNHQVKRAEASQKISLEKSEIIKVLSQRQEVIKTHFNSNESYYFNNNKIEKTLFVQDPQNFTQVKIDNVLFEKSSHNIELSTSNVLNDDNKSIYFSRCVLREEKDRLFTLSEANALNEVPLFKLENGSFKISCCSKKASTVCGKDINSTNSLFVLRSFLVKNKTITALPKETDLRYLDGVASVLVFNDSMNPTSYSIYSFILTKDCYLKTLKPDCNGNLSVNFFKTSGNVKEYGVNDSGLLEIR